MADGSRQSPLSVLVYLYDLRGGGAERQCLTLVRELVSAGVTVELILHQARGELIDQVPPGIRVIDLNRKRTRHDVLPLASYLRRNSPDILLANVDHMNIAAIVAGMLSTTRTKIVITQHNPLSDEISADGRQYRVVAPLYRILAPFISAAVAVSNGIARELVTLGGFARAQGRDDLQCGDRPGVRGTRQRACGPSMVQ